MNGVNPQWEFALNDSGDLPIKGSYELALIVIDGELILAVTFFPMVIIIFIAIYNTC